MSNGEEAIRMKQAHFLSSLFEKENGRPPDSAADIDSWITSKSKEQRAEIRRSMEAFLLATSESGSKTP
jgi:hypothetical protein